MKRTFEYTTYVVNLLLLISLIGCAAEEQLPKNEETLGNEVSVALQLPPQTYTSLVGNIRILAFNTANKLIKEFPPITAAMASQAQVITLPIGQNKIVLLGNANPQSGVDPLATPLVPGTTAYTDVMFRLQIANGKMNDPAQYLYGKDEFNLQVGPLQTRNIPFKNLTSKVRVNYTNGFASLFDSARVWIEHTGKEITFQGETTSTDISASHKFVKGVTGMLLPDSFLVFPSIATTKPVVKGKFFLNNGTSIDFSKEIPYTFIANKIVQLIFDLNGVQTTIGVTFSVSDWETVENNQQVSTNLQLSVTGGIPANYTRADLMLTYYFSKTYSYPIAYHQVALTYTGGVQQLVSPITNMEIGDYSLDELHLYDADGAFPALFTSVHFTIQLNDNGIIAPITGRSYYEQSLLKQWLLTLDENFGNTYPGAAIVNKIKNIPAYNPFTDAATLGLTVQSIAGEDRLTGINLTGKSLNSFIVPAYAAKFTELTGLQLANNAISSIDLSSLPFLQTLTLSGNNATAINLLGCKALTSFDSGFTSTDRTVLKTLTCSATGITQLSPLFTELITLNWVGCGLTDNQVTGVPTYTKLINLDLSNNQLTIYPNFAALVALGKLKAYSVQNNNIVSCALSYMTAFGEDNILNQRTGFNFWCP